MEGEAQGPFDLKIFQFCLSLKSHLNIMSRETLTKHHRARVGHLNLLFFGCFCWLFHARIQRCPTPGWKSFLRCLVWEEGSSARCEHVNLPAVFDGSSLYPVLRTCIFCFPQDPSFQSHAWNGACLADQLIMEQLSWHPIHLRPAYFSHTQRQEGWGSLPLPVGRWWDHGMLSHRQ